jgi:predicted ABC-type ATPase
MMKKPSKSVMYVFAGNNGSGKSTIRSLIMDSIGLGLVIDPDALARTIDPVNPEKVRVSAGKKAIKIVRDCIKQCHDFSIETTLAGGNVIRQMRDAKQAGYEINMFYVGLADVELNIQRVAARVRSGGHHIEEEDIRRRHTRSIENLLESLQMIDKLVVIDNSLEQGEVILEVTNGEAIPIAEQVPEWVQPICTYLKNC